MNEEVTYYNQQIWNYCDYQISTSNCIVEKFASRDKYSLSPVRLKIAVNNFKQRVNSCITLTHSDVFSFIQKFQVYEKNLSSLVSSISNDQNKQETFFIKTKKYLMVTFLHRTEYGGACVRFVISDKNTNYLDSEKVYMSLYDFLSFVMILNQFKMNYLSTSDSMLSYVATKDLSDKIESLDSKLTGYYTQIVSMNRSQISSDTEFIKEAKTAILADEFLSSVDINKERELSINETSQISSSSSKMEDDFDPFASEINDSMKSFIDTNRDSMILDTLPEKDEVKTQPANTTNAVVIKGSFTDKILQNDILNLEMYLTNIINDELPFEKLVLLINSKLGFDALDGISSEDKNSLNYILTNYVKHYVKQSIEKKMELPSSVIPVLLNKFNTNEDKISLAYDLLLYNIYYTQIRNVLKDKDYGIVANKELMCFSLKVLTMPLIFDSLNGLDKSLITSELANRFRKYTDAGVFKKLQDNLFETKKINYSLNENVLKTEAERMISVIRENKDKFGIKDVFSKFNFLMLTSDDIQKNKLTEEQIKKIVTAEFNFKKNGKLNFAECGIARFDDIPMTISKKYGVVIKKYDNTNLKRYIKDSCKNEEKSLAYSLEVADKINHSYRDLKSVNVDYAVISEDVLKAIYFWDIEKDSKIGDNYIYYSDLIKKSSLSKDMIISILMNIGDSVVDNTFTNSFMVAG